MVVAEAAALEAAAAGVRCGVAWSPSLTLVISEWPVPTYLFCNVRRKCPAGGDGGEARWRWWWR